MQKLIIIIFSVFIISCASEKKYDANEIDNLPSLDGEVFSKKEIISLNDSDRLIKFVRPKETVQNWTRLVSYSSKSLPMINNDPEKLAGQMAILVASQQKKPDISLLKVDGSGDMLIAFAIAPPNSEILEFNIFRYTRSPDGNAIISLQIVERLPYFDTTDIAASQEKHQSELSRWKAWMNYAVKYDMKTVIDEIEKSKSSK